MWKLKKKRLGHTYKKNYLFRVHPFHYLLNSGFLCEPSAKILAIGRTVYTDFRWDYWHHGQFIIGMVFFESHSTIIYIVKYDSKDSASTCRQIYYRYIQLYL